MRAQQLHAACAVAARHQPFERENIYTAVEYEAIRHAVAIFVVDSKADDLPPERVLVLLNEAVNDSRRMIGREPHQETLRAIVFEAFLRSYFDSAPSVTGDREMHARFHQLVGRMARMQPQYDLRPEFSR